MNCECHSHLNFWAIQNSGSDQIWPPRSVAFLCERQRTFANAERMLNYYWANWYELGAIWQICKRFAFANGYSFKWDRVLMQSKRKKKKHQFVLIVCYEARGGGGGGELKLVMHGVGQNCWQIDLLSTDNVPTKHYGKRTDTNWCSQSVCLFGNYPVASCAFDHWSVYQ